MNVEIIHPTQTLLVTTSKLAILFVVDTILSASSLVEKSFDFRGGVL